MGHHSPHCLQALKHKTHISLVPPLGFEPRTCGLRVRGYIPYNPYGVWLLFYSLTFCTATAHTIKIVAKRVQAYATILSAVTVFGMSNTTNTVTPSTWMSFKDVLAEIAISRSTINKWRSEGRGPSFIKLPNGELRIKRSEFEAWLIELPKVA